MNRYKTTEGMFTSAFAKMNETDDNGKLIKATEKGLREKEYQEHRLDTFRNKTKKLLTE